MFKRILFTAILFFAIIIAKCQNLNIIVPTYSDNVLPEYLCNGFLASLT